MNHGKWYRFVLDDSLSADIPTGLDFAGNYVIITDGKAAYVGESGNVGKRLRQHLQMARYSSWWKLPWGHARRVTVAVRAERVHFERAMIEARLISRLKPPHNISPGRPHRMVGVCRA